VYFRIFALFVTLSLTTMVANYLRMVRGAVLLLCLPLAKSTTSSFSLPSLPSFSLPFFGNGGLVREKPIPLPSSPVSRDLEIGVPLGLGTWAWGNQLLWGYDPENDAELQAAFNAAVDAGVTFFDTGDSYGTGKLEGRAEELLGRFRAEYPGPPEKAARLVFGTKLATYPWRVTAGSMESALLASLERLGGGGGDSGAAEAAESVELMQLHWSAANYAPWQEPGLRAGLVQCYDKGLAQAVGASNYGPVQLRSLHAALAERGVPLASNQVQFSLLSRQPLESGLFDVCAELGVVPIGYSPLALGLLSGKFNGDPDHDAPLLPRGPRGLLFKQILPGTRPLLAQLERTAAARGKSVAQVAINWSICKGAVPIVGAKSARQVKENLGAVGWRLTEEQVADLDAAAAAVPKGATQNIFQTS
jgi:pyridoxine 4-dehydrogenase